ncbi:hypothetical protein HYW42_03405 [Candidatus Daviesbacteria bacterium]|nr:hypothetical protein [Candidatus Daviesbacteria bacterium]
MDKFKKYQNHYLGQVVEIKFPLVKVANLVGASLNEIVVFERNQAGQIYSLEDHTAEVLVFDKRPVTTGSKVALTGEKSRIPVGNQLLGELIDPLGNLLKKRRSYKRPKQFYPLEVRPLGIGKRARIKQPFVTGVSMVDLLVPLGKGQRELILGDRKTGKSSFLISIVKGQLILEKNPPVVIYACIGKRKSEIKALEEYFSKEGLMEKMVMVATSSLDSPSLIYLTPFSAMAVAEYFRDLGKDVLVIMDDLSTHAKFYREISLLARRFPGRDSYPGDIFYTHARLLERAGNFKVGSREVSITCLPVAETMEGDLTGYITTNLMGVTDGHIFFDSNVFYKGRRPAINVPLSVTRVGKQTQNKLEQSISGAIYEFLNKYETAINLSHFGAELSDETRKNLILGEKLAQFFDQPYSLSLREELQILLLSLIWLGLVGDDPVFPVSICKINLIKNFEKPHIKTLILSVISADDFDSLLDNIAKKKEELIILCQQS